MKITYKDKSSYSSVFWMCYIITILTLVIGWGMAITSKYSNETKNNLKYAGCITATIPWVFLILANVCKNILPIAITFYLFFLASIVTVVIIRKKIYIACGDTSIQLKDDIVNQRVFIENTIIKDLALNKNNDNIFINKDALNNLIKNLYKDIYKEKKLQKIEVFQSIGCNNIVVRLPRANNQRLCRFIGIIIGQENRYFTFKKQTEEHFRKNKPVILTNNLKSPNEILDYLQFINESIK